MNIKKWGRWVKFVFTNSVCRSELSPVEERRKLKRTAIFFSAGLHFLQIEEID